MNTKELSNNNTILVGEFNTPLTSMDRSSKQKIIKKAMALNNILDQMDLTDIFRAFHPKTAEYILFSSSHGTFSRTGHKFKKIKVMSCIFSDHNAMKPEVNHKKKSGKIKIHGG